ncbi:unnamed protein product [Symbiodinium microadriaticum]|nr:unnamed protein product [Symbiodinium microadriaticum]
MRNWDTTWRGTMLLKASGPSTVGGSTSSNVPLFRFSDDTERALAQFERIDDVIMGGVSKSALSGDSGLASWRGLVRTEGGGFCGQRTRPFQQPLNLSGADGLYIDCGLVSDEDVARRAWKMTLRTDEGRGEVVYQAPFQPAVGSPSRVQVPFSDFRLVRGPIAIPDAPKLANLSAVYQIGFTVSKFVISEQMQTLDDFRNGTFQLDIAEIGVFSRSSALVGMEGAPETLADQEVKRNRPLVQKLLFPLLGLFFSEAVRRRRRAAALLKQRGVGPWKRFRFSWRVLRAQQGRSPVAASAVILLRAVRACAAFVLGLPLRLLLFPIFRLQARKERKKLQEKLKAERASEDARASASSA